MNFTEEAHLYVNSTTIVNLYHPKNKRTQKKIKDFNAVKINPKVKVLEIERKKKIIAIDEKS